MTLDEAKKLAQQILDIALPDEDAFHLAEFVMSLAPGVNIIEIESSEAETIPPTEPFGPAPSLVPEAPKEPEKC